MPNDNKLLGLFKTNRKIRNNIDLLNKSLDDLYQTTYSDSKQNLDNARKIRDDIDQHIDDIMNNTYTNSSIGNITKLYTKLALDKANSDKDILHSVEDAFNDQALSASVLSTWMDNKWIKDLDYEIDTVLKYMPKLKEALACKKDLVLSADHFSKDFVSYHTISSNGKEEIFSKRMEELKRVYKLPQNYEKWYDDTQKYGEQFVYIAPYSREFEKLLRHKQDYVFQSLGEQKYVSTGKLVPVEEYTIVNEGKVNESLAYDNTQFADIVNVIKESGEDNPIKNLTVSFNTSGLLLSCAEEISKVRNIVESGTVNITSMREMFTESCSVLKEAKEKIADHLIPDDLEFKEEDDRSSSEMLIGTDTKEKNSNYKVKIPGCIVKTLDRSNVVPIYVEDVCLGYYYLEFSSNDIIFDDPNSFEHTAGLNTMGNSGRMSRNVERMQQQNRDKLIGYIAQQLTSVIDAKFINNNQDLRVELYHILKHCEIFNNPNNSVNGNISITFLSAEDVTHLYFNQDPITKRGISDLAYSLFPAKLYSCMYINNVLGQLTRGQDKRVYYVKQNVETNVSKTLLNVLNQIKKGNFGIRQMENLSNILNITGKFNDYLIPLSPNGDPPIQFDIMPGQQFTDNSELMNMLEKMAIDPTEIPFDLIEARQSLDYAIQATMSNSKVMRMTYKRQDATQNFFSEITSKIYHYEYEDDERIEMSLPAPSFLNMTNGAQLINGTVEYINTIAQSRLSDESEEVQKEFVKIALDYYIPSHMNVNQINKMITQAKMNVAKKTNPNEQEEQE